MFQYPIPANPLERWKSQVVVDSHSPISLAIATATAILRSLDAVTTPNHPVKKNHYLRDRESVLSLTADIQAIVGDAMTLASNMFPQHPSPWARAKRSPATYGPNKLNTTSSPSADAQKPSDV